MKTKTTITAEIPPQHKATLRAMAKSSGRSLSSEIRIAIEAHFSKERQTCKK
jgi:predicted DNA-binding protein